MPRDLGREEIDAFYAGAVDGTFRMDADTAQKCADSVQMLISAVLTRQEAALVASYAKFGDFESGKQMEQGFKGKNGELAKFISEFVMLAERLRQSFLLAGKVVSQQEADNAQVLNSTDIGNGK